MCCCFSYIRRLRFHRADRIVDELVMSCCWCWAGTHRALCSYGRASSHAAALTYNSSWKLCFIFGLLTVSVSQFPIFINLIFSLFSLHTHGGSAVDRRSECLVMRWNWISQKKCAIISDWEIFISHSFFAQSPRKWALKYLKSALIDFPLQMSISYGLKKVNDSVERDPASNWP